MERERAKEIIKSLCFIQPSEHVKPVSNTGQLDPWLFDFRPFLLKSETLQYVANEFWNYFENRYPFQVCSKEVAGVPLLGAIIAEGARRQKPITGVIVRKSRKKTGLQKLIEGNLENKPIILIDDLINTGESFKSQLHALEDYKELVVGYFTILRFRNLTAYPFVKKENLFFSLFSLEELGIPLPHYIPNAKGRADIFREIWKFESPNPNHFFSLPKSAPVIDNEKLYFGSDSGNFWALNQETGEVVWKYKVGKSPTGKEIFSSPVLSEDLVYFGAYDGNFYALRTEDGSLKWRAREADWIGSSPALASNLNLVFVGLECGLINKRGALAAYEMDSGKLRWLTTLSKEFIHASPVYSKKFNAVGIGSNDKNFYLTDATTGQIKWRFETDGEIKGGGIFDKKRNLVIFGSADGFLYTLDVYTGTLKGKWKTENVVYSTPVLFDSFVLIASEDKNLYCINLEKGNLEWKFLTNGRIMASPLIVGENIYIGSNDGKFYKVTKGGIVEGFIQTTERITNHAIYNETSKTFFVATNANQIIAIREEK